MLFMDITHLPDGPLMAVDHGEKTLGLAVCNTARTVVTPLATIWRKKFTEDATQLLDLFEDRKCKGLIMGMPVHMDGGDGARAQSARSFVTNLLRIKDIPVAYQDERLSTFEATERLIQAGHDPSDIKDMLDSQAAAVILEAAIRRINGGSDGSLGYRFDPPRK